MEVAHLGGRTGWLAVVGLCFAVAGCSSGEDDGWPGNAACEMAAVQAFDEFEIVWLGREFGGMRLASVDLPGDECPPDWRDDYSVPRRAAYLIYGCQKEREGYIGPGSDCGPALEIVIDPRYRRGRGAPPRRRISGVPAHVERHPGDSEVMLYGRGLTVFVRASRSARALRAAKSLREMNDPPPDAPQLSTHPRGICVFTPGDGCGSLSALERSG